MSFFYTLFLILTSLLTIAQSQELSGSNSSSQTYNRRELRDRASQAAALRRANYEVTRCSEHQKKEKEQKLEQCTQNFREEGLQHALAADERMNPELCPTITEASSLRTQGCWEVFSFSPDELLESLPALLGSDQHRHQSKIEELIGPPPRGPSSGLVRRMNRGQLSESEATQIQAQRATLREYNQRRDRVIASLNEAEISAEAELREAYSRINSACLSTLPSGNRRQNQRRQIALKACKIEEANRIGCTKCVEQLTRIPFNSRFMASMREEMAQWKGFGCFDYKTQGRMMCEAASLALAGTGVVIGGTKLIKYFGRRMAQRATQTAREQTAALNRNTATETVKTSGDAAEIQGAIGTSEPTSL